tara:strand:- start:61 stop:318 length:258 start_codon:yes stop_codon:yes gene_type:complete
MQYRMHIDIPLGHDEEEAIKAAKQIAHWHLSDVDAQLKIKNLSNGKVQKINYRLGHDEDRQKSNYLDKNENGHVSNKKTQIHFGK